MKNCNDKTTDTHGDTRGAVDLKNSEVEAPKKKYASLEEEVNDELERKGQGGRWVCYLFLIATLPNILNGSDVCSYVFLGRMPDSYWCEVPALLNASYTKMEMQQISTGSIDPNSCKIFKHDYAFLSTMNFTSALEYTETHPLPELTSCLSSDDARIHYEMDGSSIVPEWDLVCEHSVWRTIVQVAISIGKGIGATTVGILSDKYGRKKLFGAGCACYILACTLCTFGPWYWMFLIGRFLQGTSTSGLIYPPFITMTENVAGKHRHWMGVFFNLSYPIGMFYLAGAGYLLNSWRYLQLTLAIPALSLIGFWFFSEESPRWLISKGRIEDAYKVVFGKAVDKDKKSLDKPILSVSTEKTNQSKDKAKRGVWKEVSSLYSTPRLCRIQVICNFAFFTAAFSYYTTAINASNLSANKVLYVVSTGSVDILSYIGATVLLTYVGRKWSCFWTFALSATCMLALLLIPEEQTSAIVAVSMIGRIGICSVYAIIALYAVELFPTEVRNSAVGVCSMFGHVGSMLAPFVVDFLGVLAWFIPTTICGIALLLAGLLVLLNPETGQSKMVDHVDSEEKISEEKIKK